ncbi:MAG: redox-regulated ATPase YchF [Candidatus Berkelbacteria bacterium]
MNLKIGLVGLPNVGKSTLFNALVKGSHAEAANYPFCTIEPNIGIVEVPDPRLKPLAEMSKSKKIVPAVIEFVDIAGLVRGASKGEGLGNKFLAHIRECDAVAMVVRFFEDENVTHVSSKIDPLDDINTIETELQLADISTVEKRLFSVEKELKSGTKESVYIHSGLQKIKDKLYDGKNAREADLDDKETAALKGLGLMTQKPILYIANCGEEQLPQISKSEFLSSNEIPIPKDLMSKMIPISAKVEAELNELEEQDKQEFLKELGLEKSGLERLIVEAFDKLGLQTYLTTGEMETRAWTIHKGYTAPQAAGVIHGDFERGFIAAEVVPWQDLYAQGSWTAAKARGLVRTEGKNYIMQDGDVVLFRFNV